MDVIRYTRPSASDFGKYDPSSNTIYKTILTVAQRFTRASPNHTGVLDLSARLFKERLGL